MIQPPDFGRPSPRLAIRLLRGKAPAVTVPRPDGKFPLTIKPRGGFVLVLK